MRSSLHGAAVGGKSREGAMPVHLSWSLENAGGQRAVHVPHSWAATLRLRGGLVVHASATKGLIWGTFLCPVAHPTPFLGAQE